MTNPADLQALNEAREQNARMLRYEAVMVLSGFWPLTDVQEYQSGDVMDRSIIDTRVDAVLAEIELLERQPGAPITWDTSEPEGGISYFDFFPYG